MNSIHRPTFGGRVASNAQAQPQARSKTRLEKHTHNQVEEAEALRTMGRSRRSSMCWLVVFAEPEGKSKSKKQNQWDEQEAEPEGQANSERKASEERAKSKRRSRRVGKGKHSKRYEQLHGREATFTCVERLIRFKGLRTTLCCKRVSHDTLQHARHGRLVDGG